MSEISWVLPVFIQNGQTGYFSTSLRGWLASRPELHFVYEDRYKCEIPVYLRDTSLLYFGLLAVAAPARGAEGGYRRVSLLPIEAMTSMTIDAKTLNTTAPRPCAVSSWLPMAHTPQVMMTQRSAKPPYLRNSPTCFTSFQRFRTYHSGPSGM